uniref:Neurokinin A n=1 Tax=Salmo trutta TaxID=8032 RepID=A0A674DRL3_SALTR
CLTFLVFPVILYKAALAKLCILFIQSKWPQSEQYKEILKRMTRKPESRKFFGLMGKRGSGQKFESFVGLMGKRSSEEQGKIPAFSVCMTQFFSLSGHTVDYCYSCRFLLMDLKQLHTTSN